MLQRYAAESRKKLTGFTAQALRAVEAYHWPGNVRELENRIRRGVIMADGPRMSPEDLELASLSTRSAGPKLREAREGLERDLIQRALSRHQDNITQAAAELGISRPTLYDRMEKLGMYEESGQ
jgi:two-component system NtrC family response regulator